MGRSGRRWLVVASGGKYLCIFAYCAAWAQHRTLSNKSNGGEITGEVNVQRHWRSRMTRMTHRVAPDAHRTDPVFGFPIEEGTN
jgi:hypothetical protein